MAIATPILPAIAATAVMNVATMNIFSQNFIKGIFNIVM